MNTEYGKIERDIEITSELILHGMIDGSVVVISGGVFDLHGMVTKNLIVESGGIANVFGTVSGDAINSGGELNIYGTIGGQLIKESGFTQVDANAMIALNS
jgi:hypothetical protein